MMEAQYIRKARASYMVLAERKELKEWERQMIANAPAGKILFAERVQENGEHYLWYEITGKQALDALLETEKLEYSLLCEILLGIYGAVEFLEGMLLEAEEILLMPGEIFVDYRTEEVYFCYYPGNENGLSEGLRELLEGLLAHLDHEDERAVSLAYGLYEDISKGGMNLSELKRRLRLPYEKEGENERREQEDESEGQFACPQKEDSERAVSFRQQKQEEEILREEYLQGEYIQRECMQEVHMQEEYLRKELAGEQWQEREEKRENRKKKKAARRGKHHIEKIEKEKTKREKTQKENSLQMAIFENIQNVLEGISGFWAGRGIHGRKAKAAPDEEVFFFEPEEEEIPKSTHPTVLLAELTRPPEGILRYEGKGPCKDLVIEGDSLVIGSGEDCGGYIPSTTVSRRHARVSKKEGIYFIEDLNSSNGTYVGGELLNYKTKMSLQKNEIVIFADEKFRFI